MKRGLAVFWLCMLSPAAVWAQSGIVAPRAGCVRDRSGSLRTVYGVASVFLPGPAIRTGLLSAGCSDQLAAAKTAASVEVRDANMRLLGRWRAAAGPARFAFPRSGSAVYVYLPASRELQCFEPKRGPHTVAAGTAFDGEALAVAVPDARHLTAVVQREDGLRLMRVLLANGHVEQDLPLDDVALPVFLATDGAIVYTEGREAVIRRANGVEHRLALPGTALAIEPMGPDLAAIAVANRPAPLALRLIPGREQLLSIPEARR